MKTLAFPKFQILTVLRSSLALFLTAGLMSCGAADRVAVQNDGVKPVPFIEKGTAPISLIEGEPGLFLHALNELGWNLRAADIAINRIPRNETDGCVQYRKVDQGTTFAVAQFSCTSQLAFGNSKSPSHRRRLVGRESYSEGTERNSTINMGSNFEQSIYLINGSKLIGLGNVSRSLKVNRSSSDYELTFRAVYAGKVALESDRVGEMWEANQSGTLTASRATGTTLPAGFKLKLVHTPERPRLEKADLKTTLDLSATSAITFMPVAISGTVQCLRPIGSFSWTRTFAGEKDSGKLTTSANGILVSGTGNETIPWGSLCLEL